MFAGDISRTSTACRDTEPLAARARSTSLDVRGVTIPVALGAIAVSAAGGLVLGTVDLGPLSAHMAHHIALMNVVAPLAAMVFAGRLRTPFEGARRVLGAREAWLAAAAQLILLWAWHLPSAQRWGMSSVGALVAMHASLFLAAACFWMGVLDLTKDRRWHAILVLLVTGKLACLLGSLLIFAPRVLYATPAQHIHHLGHAAAPYTLADQQLAGLLMVVACPLSYLLAGVVIASQIMSELGGAPRPADGRQVPPPLGR